jgi:hypothetical protein
MYWRCKLILNSISVMKTFHHGEIDRKRIIIVAEVKLNNMRVRWMIMQFQQFHQFHLTSKKNSKNFPFSVDLIFNIVTSFAKKSVHTWRESREFCTWKGFLQDILKTTQYFVLKWKYFTLSHRFSTNKTAESSAENFFYSLSSHLLSSHWKGLFSFLVNFQ